MASEATRLCACFWLWARRWKPRFECKSLLYCRNCSIRTTQSETTHTSYLLHQPTVSLDEFDVFLDTAARKLTMNALIHTAKSLEHRQFIFITPQDLSGVQADPKLKIFKMKPPVRASFSLLMSCLPFNKLTSVCFLGTPQPGWRAPAADLGFCYSRMIAKLAMASNDFIFTSETMSE